MSTAVRGRMLIVDASCLVAALIGVAGSEAVRARLAADGDHVAPHVIDVEVFSAIRREHLRGHLDRTAAAQAVEDLGEWPGSATATAR